MLSLRYEKDSSIMIHPAMTLLDRSTNESRLRDRRRDTAASLVLLFLSSGQRSLDTSSVPGNEGSVIIHRYQPREPENVRFDARRRGQGEKSSVRKRMRRGRRREKGGKRERERDSGWFLVTGLPVWKS